MECPVLLARLTVAEDQVLMSVKYDDVFGEVEEQVRVIPVLARLLEIRGDLLDTDKDLPMGLNIGPSLHCPNNVANGNK